MFKIPKSFEFIILKIVPPQRDPAFAVIIYLGFEILKLGFSYALHKVVGERSWCSEVEP